MTAFEIFKARLRAIFLGQSTQITRTTGDGEIAINVSSDGHVQIAETKGKNSAAINIRRGK